MKVKIGEYNNTTKRLTVTVTNNYSETIIGKENAQSVADIHSGASTQIQFMGYFKENHDLKDALPILMFYPTKDIKSGETVIFQLLMPLYSSKNHQNYENDTYDYSNSELDAMYDAENYKVDNNQYLVYENNDHMQIGMSAFKNYDNYFVKSSMVFKKVPKEARLTDEEVVKYFRYNF